LRSARAREAPRRQRLQRRQHASADRAAEREDGCRRQNHRPARPARPDGARPAAAIACAPARAGVRVAASRPPYLWLRGRSPSRTWRYAGRRHHGPPTRATSGAGPAIGQRGGGGLSARQRRRRGSSGPGRPPGPGSWTRAGGPFQCRRRRVPRGPGPARTPGLGPPNDSESALGGRPVPVQEKGERDSERPLPSRIRARPWPGPGRLPGDPP
jgi:hypothetical protein